MIDTAFLLSVLNDGRWHSNTEILQASFAERGCGLTVHSRASDLRKKGYVVETKSGGYGTRRVCFYRLGALNEAAMAGASRGAVEKAVAVSLSASPIPADSIAVDRGGALEPLFVCEIDESAGLRGAYHD